MTTALLVFCAKLGDTTALLVFSDKVARLQEMMFVVVNEDHSFNFGWFGNKRNLIHYIILIYDMVDWPL